MFIDLLSSRLYSSLIEIKTSDIGTTLMSQKLE